MDSSKGTLTSLQKDFLEAWFRATDDFFLTGRAVIASFMGAPRITRDLDLFTSNRQAFEEATYMFESICRQIDANSQAARKAPYYGRYIISRDGEEIIVDLVLDKAPQIFNEKERLESGIVIDRAEEILVNKICSIVGRSETRDYYDIHFLWKSGYDVDRALELAQMKDGGVDEEALLFVLSGINWDSFKMPGFEEAVVEDI